MSEEKFTPGPWKAQVVWEFDDDDQVKYLGYAGVQGPKGPSGIWDWVFIEPDCDDPGVEQQIIVDTHLIAAAPDLYHALLLAIPYVINAYECAFPDSNENARVLDVARAALAKARGEY